MRCKQYLQAAVFSLAVMASAAGAVEITGAGATFPYPIYAKWAEAYRAASGQTVNYQSMGSGAGIKQIKAATVDFGATDRPLSAAELAEAGLIQFPAIMGGVVPIVNVPGVLPGELKLSPEVLADIYLGHITQWNDAKLAALNPGLTLPAQAITVVHRADSSGTTFLWTTFLSETVAAFKQSVGAGTTVKWPTGVGGKGNEGVAATVQRLRGSVGYVEYAYAQKNQLAHAQLQNQAGVFVQPGMASFKAAAAGATWPQDMAVLLTNQPGADSWPITGASFILMHKTQQSAERGKAVLAFFDWAYQHGGKDAHALDYVALPDSVVQTVQQGWQTLQDANGAPLWP